MAKLGELLAAALDRVVEPDRKPRAYRPWRFLNVGKALARIRELETALGLPASKPSLRIAEANRRVADLEDQLAARQTVPAKAAAPVASQTPAPARPRAVQPPSVTAKPSTAPPAVKAPAPAAAPKPTTPPATAIPAARPNRKQLDAIAKVLHVGTESHGDAELFANLEVRAFQEHVRFAGMASDELIGREVYRTKLFGAARAVAAERQQTINRIMKGKSRA